MRIEIIVLFVYFIGMIGVGLYWNKRAKSSEDYMLGGRGMGPFITALTLQTTAKAYGDEWKANLEWAYLSWQSTDNLMMRFGRLRTPRQGEDA